MKRNRKKPSTSPTIVAPGMHVEVDLVSKKSEKQRLSFVIVPDDKADLSAGFLGTGTPLAKAILGQGVGSEVPYPVSDLRAVLIVAASEAGPAPTDKASTRREAVLKEATEKAEFTTAQIFATSADTKWGDYDADALNQEKWKKDD